MLAETKWLDAWFYAPASIAKILVAVPRLEIVACNQQATRLYACQSGDLEGTSILQWSCEPKRTEATLRAASCHGMTVSEGLPEGMSVGLPEQSRGIQVHRRRDGTTFTAKIAVSMHRDDQQQAYVCLYVMQQSELVGQMQRFDAQDECFRAVADCTYDWESWLDLNGRVVWINPAVERLTGYTVKECMGWCNYPLEMVVAEDRDRFACLLQAATCGTSGNDVEFRVTRKDGSLKWFAVSWQPLKHSDDQTMGVRMSKRDISDRKTIEEELKRHTQHLEELASERARRIVELDQRRLQMQKLAALGQMAASVAHEINNPLAGIKNAMRLIRGREQLKPDNKQLFDLVDKEVTRIAGLLSQMYQLCRPSISAPDAGCVVALLDEVVKMVLAQFEFKRIRIRRVNWPVKLIGLVRESEVKQIIHNLLVNACEASPVDGEVNIVLSTNQQTLVLQVVDHGAGIPDHILSRIFEPFVTSKHDSGRVGLGLGLSISNSLAQALDGTIEVQSAMGQGSQFTLSIPFTAVERLG